MVQQPYSLGGSGSSYIYGYCDANYRPDMTQAECEEFVKNGKTPPRNSSLILTETCVFVHYFRLTSNLPTMICSDCPRDLTRWLFWWCDSHCDHQ